MSEKTEPVLLAFHSLTPAPPPSARAVAQRTVQVDGPPTLWQ